MGVADANLVPRNSEDVYFAEKKDGQAERRDRGWWKEYRERKRGEDKLERRERTTSTPRAVPARSVYAGIRLRLGPPGDDAPRDEVRGGRVGRALGHRNTAGKVRHNSPENRLARQGVRRGARVHFCVRIEAALVLKHRTVLDDAGGRRARRDGAREHAAVPAVQEVAVQSIASRIAVREDEAPAVVQSIEWRHVEPHLIEDGDEVVWV